MDQRPNRAFAARLCDGQEVLDLYTYAGAFALAAAAGGARQVTAVDSSEAALRLAAESGEASGLAHRLRLERADVFDWLEAKAGTRQRYSVVIADPPQAPSGASVP